MVDFLMSVDIHLRAYFLSFAGIETRRALSLKSLPILALLIDLCHIGEEIAVEGSLLPSLSPPQIVVNLT